MCYHFLVYDTLPFVKNTINLLAFSTGPLGFWEKFYIWALTVGRYIIIITELVVLVCFFYKFKIDNDLASAKDNFKVDLQAAKQNHAELQTIKKYQTQITDESTILAQQAPVAPLLSHTLSLIPSGIFVTNLTINDLGVMELDGQITGTSSTQFNQIQALANVFKADTTYNGVVLSDITANSNSNQTVFVLTMNEAK